MRMQGVASTGTSGKGGKRGKERGNHGGWGELGQGMAARLGGRECGGGENLLAISHDPATMAMAAVCARTRGSTRCLGGRTLRQPRQLSRRASATPCPARRCGRRVPRCQQGPPPARATSRHGAARRRGRVSGEYVGAPHRAVGSAARRGHLAWACSVPKTTTQRSVASAAAAPRRPCARRRCFHPGVPTRARPTVAWRPAIPDSDRVTRFPHLRPPFLSWHPLHGATAAAAAAAAGGHRRSAPPDPPPKSRAEGGDPRDAPNGSGWPRRAVER